VADILTETKMIRPMIERPFIPTEVEKLNQQTRKFADEIPMSKATLIGKVEKGQGLDEVKYLFI
jgi:hypothetical protein